MRMGEEGEGRKNSRKRVGRGRKGGVEEGAGKKSASLRSQTFFHKGPAICFLGFHIQLSPTLWSFVQGVPAVLQTTDRTPEEKTSQRGSLPLQKPEPKTQKTTTV